jgi:hypothetical protein
MMCQLYTRLSRLVVWLGVADGEESKSAIELIKFAARAIRDGQEPRRAWMETLASKYEEEKVAFTVPLTSLLTRS